MFQYSDIHDFDGFSNTWLCNDVQTVMTGLEALQ